MIEHHATGKDGQPKPLDATAEYWSVPELTRTPRGLRWGTGYAYPPPALGTYRRRRAACPQGPAYCTYGVRAYQPRAYHTYRAPWHPRSRLPRYISPGHGCPALYCRWSADVLDNVLAGQDEDALASPK